MPTAFALLLLYLACLAFHQSGPKRTLFMRVKESAAVQISLRAAGWLLSFGALMIVIGIMGFERGFPTWFGLFMLAGISYLVIGALRPGWQLRSAYGVAALCAAIGSVASFGGAA